MAQVGGAPLLRCRGLRGQHLACLGGPRSADLAICPPRPNPGAPPLQVRRWTVFPSGGPVPCPTDCQLAIWLPAPACPSTCAQQRRTEPTYPQWFTRASNPTRNEQRLRQAEYPQSGHLANYRNKRTKLAELGKRQTSLGTFTELPVAKKIAERHT